MPSRTARHTGQRVLALATYFLSLHGALNLIRPTPATDTALVWGVSGAAILVIAGLLARYRARSTGPR